MGGYDVLLGSCFILATTMLALCHKAQSLADKVGAMTDDETDADRIARLLSTIDQQRIHLLELGEILERDQAQAEAMARSYDNVQRQLEAYRKLRFPTLLRKMWSGGEVAQWLAEQHERIGAHH